ncbi:uncharacterized protein LOC144448545 [Glandiceps talaboti]
MELGIHKSYLCILCIVLVVGHSDQVSAAAIRQLHTKLKSPANRCSLDQYLFKIPPNIYTNYEGVDQALDPGYICRQCQVCADGAKIISGCKPTADTVCGDCLKKDYVFDQGTKSCQPLNLVYGVEGFKAKLTVTKSTSGGNGSMVSSSTIDTLFVAAVTVFSMTLLTAVLLVVTCLVKCITGRINTKSNSFSGRNLPSELLAFNDPNGKETEKKRNVNENCKEDKETECRTLCTEQTESVEEYVHHKDGDRQCLIKKKTIDI